MACYHLVTNGISINDITDDAAAMHLHVAEGQGLNDDDIHSATKLVLLAPTSMDVLLGQTGWGIHNPMHCSVWATF
jgi:hypothetical protein